MAFYDVRLPVDIERGARGGPSFDTTIKALKTGHEKRNQNWEQSKGAWDVSYGITHLTDLENVIDLFYAMEGSTYSFRFKDWADFRIGNPLSGDVSTRQQIGLGDGTTTTFQLVRRYGFVGIKFHERDVTRPCAGTVRIFNEAVELTAVESGAGAGEFSVDYGTGIVTLGEAPSASGGSGDGGAEIVAAIAEFDVPVRFEADNLEIDVTVFDSDAVGSLPRIGLVETRPEEDA